MDLGDIVIYGGQHFYVRGVDPVGAHPRQLYLENVRTGERVSVAFEQQGATREKGRRALRLLRSDAADSPGGDEPAQSPREAEHGEEDSRG